MTHPNYKTFLMKEVFDFYTGSILDSSLLNDGQMPRITATDVNNGVAFFTNHSTNKKFRVFENFISISFLGSVFYHKGQASLDMKIHGIKPKKYCLNTELAMYLIPLIKNFTSKYEYGYQLSMRLLPEQRIVLPVDEDGKPDWIFMETHISTVLRRKNKSVIEFLYSDLVKIGNFDSVNLGNVTWDKFKIKELFSIAKVKGESIKNYNEGLIPYISTSNMRNGLSGFIETQESIISPKNSLSVDPINGTTYYHPYNFVGRGYAGSSINLLYSDNINEFTGLFLSKAIEKASFKKASYGIHFNGDRLSEAFILLPSKDNLPDYYFMENYIKQIKETKLRETTKFIENKS